jgi:hypothetical protein
LEDPPTGSTPVPSTSSYSIEASTPAMRRTLAAPDGRALSAPRAPRAQPGRSCGRTRARMDRCKQPRLIHHAWSSSSARSSQRRPSSGWPLRQEADPSALRPETKPQTIALDVTPSSLSSSGRARSTGAGTSKNTAAGQSFGSCRRATAKSLFTLLQALRRSLPSWSRLSWTGARSTSMLVLGRSCSSRAPLTAGPRPADGPSPGRPRPWWRERQGCGGSLRISGSATPSFHGGA